MGAAQHSQHKCALLSSFALLQLRRLMLRDGSSAPDAQARIDAQLPLAVKEQLADVAVTNDGGLQQLHEQVTHLVNQLQQRSMSWCSWLTTPSGLLLGQPWGCGGWGAGVCTGRCCGDNSAG